MSAKKESLTLKNLESALAGEAVAQVKYRYFAKICREHGDEASAELFEETAAQEVQHAFGHLDLLYPKTGLDPERCLSLAIEGETYEYTEMYPQFRDTAVREQEAAAVAEFSEQIEESKEHAGQFQARLQMAAKRFSALTRVEQRHAQQYRAALTQRRQGADSN